MAPTTCRAVLLCGTVALCAVALPSSAQSPGEVVRTVAGSGALGMQDGPALSGSFLVPTGLARASDGTIYISDEAGQRIRALKDGRISTVAGSGDLGTLGMSVTGGYRDGPALSAQFNHPMGLAVGPDGALYIADALNKRIRTLDHGVVSTVVSGLISPEDVAFDRAGNLWIADYGGGVKRWDGHAVSVPALSGGISDKPLALSISPDETDPKLVVDTVQAVYEYDVQAAAQAGPAPYTGGVSSIPIPSDFWTFGSPRQLVALGKHQIVYSDPVTNTVRYLRFNVQPLATQPYSTRLAGGSDYKAIDNAGFADGADARFYSPRGILVYGSTIFVADAGNRRIRALGLPWFRSQEYGLEGAEPYDTSHFEIALVGASNVFFDSHDNADSICGTIERRLNASHRIAKPVRCHTHRIDGADMNKMWSYIDNYLAFRHVDEYIIVAVPRFVDAQTVPLTHKLLDGTKTRLLFVWYPSNWEVSDSEDLVQRQTDFVTFPDDTVASLTATARRASATLSGIPNVAIYDLFWDEVHYEKEAVPPLWNAPDTHMNVRGNVFVGDHIAAALLKQIAP
jgi:hypothetical protein